VAAYQVYVDPVSAPRHLPVAPPFLSLLTRVTDPRTGGTTLWRTISWDHLGLHPARCALNSSPFTLETNGQFSKLIGCLWRNHKSPIYLLWHRWDMTPITMLGRRAYPCSININDCLVASLGCWNDHTSVHAASGVKIGGMPLMSPSTCLLPRARQHVQAYPNQWL
jgi:hypothetical protein